MPCVTKFRAKKSSAAFSASTNKVCQVLDLIGQSEIKSAFVEFAELGDRCDASVCHALIPK